MLDIPYLGLAGVAGAGKDTVYERLREIGGDRFVRLSVADPLKESVAALFGISLEELDEWKRDKNAFVGWGFERPDEPGAESLIPTWSMSWREFLQRYGTEAHRGVFGQDFWLDEWEKQAKRLQMEALTIVNTSVRFENEAERIIELGGQVWEVIGPQDAGAGGHESEAQLPYDLFDETIDNSVRLTSVVENGFGAVVDRYPDFSALDDQIATLLHGGTLV